MFSKSTIGDDFTVLRLRQFSDRLACGRCRLLLLHGSNLNNETREAMASHIAPEYCLN